MRMGRCFILLLLFMPSVSVGAQQPHGESEMILWPETSAYAQEVTSLRLSPTAAHTVLVANTRTHPDRFFDPTPMFLLGGKYFFAEPRKKEIRLQGFFVDGTTGRIEYRVSDKTVSRGAKSLPDDAFKSSTIINKP